MDSNTTVAIMFVSVSSAVAGVVIAILTYRLKVKIIKSGKIDENSIKLLSINSTDKQLFFLKWGLILLMCGIGLMILQYLPYPSNSPFPYGFEAAFLALGFLLYFIITKKIYINN
ncbi:MAG: hypothetical protein V5804_00085 [Mucilaginibacter sp.]|uniref:hypothetical protein n=1 Tax=Mucilaginibacter sp. TaxID=1882438 RepID=UPI0034E56E2C